jgi:hypothetical protein
MLADDALAQAAQECEADVRKLCELVMAGKYHSKAFVRIIRVKRAIEYAQAWLDARKGKP